MQSLSRLWRYLSSNLRSPGTKATWRERLGDELAVIEPWLIPEEALAQRYPCTLRANSRCPRRVVQHGHDDLVAVCDAGLCETLQLTRDALLVWRLDLAAVANAIAHAWQYDGAIGGPVLGRIDLCSLGMRAGRDGLPQPAVLLLGPDPHPSLSALHLQLGGPMTVAIPTASSLTPELLQQTRHQGVELRVCERELVAVGDVLLAREVAERLPTPLAAHVAQKPEAHCLAISHDGERSLTHDQYRAIIETTDLDLLIDLASVRAGRVSVGKRADGEWVTSTILPIEARVLAELIYRRREQPTLRRLRSIPDDMRHPIGPVKRGRPAVDVRLGRTQWRSFHTAEGQKTVTFRPPADLRWAVLLSPDEPFLKR